MMKNPCNNCLVKVCCTEVCEPKNEYSDEAVNFLCRLAQNIYKPNGKRRRNLSKLVTSAYDEAVKVCDENSIQNNAILNRYVRAAVP